VGSKLYYWHSEESDESYHFELKRIDLKNMAEEDELMKSFKVDRLDKKYNLIGVMYYKQFFKVAKNASAMSPYKP